MKSENIQFAGKQVKHLLEILKSNKPIPRGSAAVFFDIDGTINRNDCLELLISEIVRKDLLPSDKEKVSNKKNWIVS